MVWVRNYYSSCVSLTVSLHRSTTNKSLFGFVPLSYFFFGTLDLEVGTYFHSIGRAHSGPPRASWIHTLPAYAWRSSIFKSPAINSVPTINAQGLKRIEIALPYRQEFGLVAFCFWCSTHVKSYLIISILREKLGLRIVIYQGAIYPSI